MKHILTLLLVTSLCSFGSSQNDFYQTDNIQQIDITFNADNWKYLLDSLRFNGDELLTGDLQVNGTALTEVGIRYRDGRSFTPNGKRNGLYIDLGSKDYQGHHVINLSSALRDPSLVREVLASEIARTYFNAPAANFAEVTINGEPYGLFANVEAVEKGYLKDRFENAKGTLVTPTEEPQTIVSEECSRNVFGSLQHEESANCVAANWKLLQGDLGLVQTLSSTLASSPADLAKLLDIDATLWMLAFNNVLVNLNSYTGQYASNYYLYQPLGGKITPVLGELNLAFGSYKNDGANSSDLSTATLLTLSPDLHLNNEERPLISVILADEINYKQYLAHFRTILVEWVMSGKLENRAKALQAMISEARRNDPGQYYSPIEFNQSLTEVIGKRSRIPGLVDFMDKRASWLESQEVYIFLPPAISKVGVEGRERFSSTQLDEFRIHATVEDYPKNVYLYYRFNENEAFKMVPMLNDGEHYDGQANDGVFGAVIKPTDGQNQIQYYLMAENVKTVSFSPSHYNFEQYKTTLREVNQQEGVFFCKLSSMNRILIICSLWGFLSFALQAQDKLYTLEHIVEVRINFSEPNWHELLDSLKERGQDERLIADVNVDGKAYPNSGIRYKGNSSYFNVRNAGGRKLPFNIKVNFQEKDARLPGGYETLKLSNVFRDPSFIREVLSYDIARKYVPAPRANYSRVYVNDDYMGLYNLSESVDEDFLKQYYGSKKGVFFKCDPSWDQSAPGNCKKGNNASLEFLGKDSVCYFPYYEIKSKNGWGELMELINVINNNPEALEQQMNINEALWMLAYNNVMVNLDSYIGRLCHNYYLYQDEYNTWHPVLWDMNLCFGGFRYTGMGAPLSNEAMQDMSLFLHYKENNTQRPFVLKLLGVSHYRKMYLAHVKTIVEENFSNGWYKERANEIRALISEDVNKDPNRLYSMELYEKNLNETVRVDNSSIIGITELMDKRAENILAHPLMQKAPPVVSEVQHQVVGEEAIITASVTEADEVWIYFRQEAFAPWQRQPMAANENNEWAAQIELTEEVQYYVVAENKYIAALSPARAAREFYEIVVK